MHLRNAPAVTVLALFFSLLAGTAAPALSVSPSVGFPGGTVNVAVSLVTDTNIPQLQFDLRYETNFLSSGAPISGPALADQIILSSEPSHGVRRVQLFSLSNSPMTNGVLVTIPFYINANAAARYTGLFFTNTALYNPLQELIPLVTLNNGSLEILGPPRVTSIQRSTGGTVRLQVTGPASHMYVIQATADLLQGPWLPIYTNQASVGTFPFVDSAATKLPRRFYRAVLVP